jgi:hypothetical protein
MLAGMLMAATLSLPLSAQRFKLTEGSLDLLKGQTEINTEFTYDNLKVGKYDNEEDYIRDKTAE